MTFPHTDADYETAGKLFEDGRYDEALRLYTAFATDGCPSSQLLVGWMHAQGWGTPESVEQAERWYAMAVPELPAEAQYRLGRLYRKQKRHGEARRSFEASAKLGYASSKFELGVMLMRGEGVPIDESKGLALVQEAASTGNLLARRVLLGRKLSGREGLRAIPAGVVELIRCLRDFWDIYRRGDMYDTRLVG